MAKLAFTLFGPVADERGSATLISFRTAKGLALLAYLVVEADRPHARATLAALLWPDQPEAPALRNLTQTLTRLREALDDDGALIVASRQTLQWRGAGAACDLERFRLLLQRDDNEALAQAIELYRGPLLDGFSLPECDTFTEWLLLAREQLQQQALAALRTLAERRLAAAEYAGAAEAARRHLALDPWREEPHRQLMRALAGAGDHTAALEAFARCRQTFAVGLGLEPDATTIALAAQIAQELARQWGGEPAVAPAAAPAQAPAAATGPSPPDELHNLSAPLDGLVGREEELARLHGLLGGAARLVTVLGAGGAGKTRLALAAAWTLRRSFADGVWWVPLAGVEPSGDRAARADLLAAIIAAATGRQLPGRQPLAELASALREREILLVLDNCEHLPELAFVARALLEAASQLRVLATSRAPLGMESEALLRLDGLPVPAEGASDPATYAGVRLFLERAASQAPDWGFGAGEIAEVARLCRLLDGMPLAIELAAHWVGHYTPAEIAAALEDDPDFLAASDRDRPTRQRSLRAVFAYSWRLLAAHEQQALARLAVFRGGFDRAAAQAVAEVRMPTLAALVDSSLVRQIGVGQYGLHELLRQFAAEELASLEPDGTTHDRHAAYYLALLARQEAPLRGTHPREAAAVVEANGDNIRQVWYHAVRHRQWQPILEAVHALALYYRITGLGRRGLQLIDMAVAQLAAEGAAGPEDADRTRRSLGATLQALRAYFLGREAFKQEGLAAARTAAAEACALGDQLLEALALLHEAMNRGAMPSHIALPDAVYAEVQAKLEQAIVRCRTYQAASAVEESRARAIEAESRYFMVRFLNARGRHQEALQICNQALQICRQAGNRHLEGRISFGSAEALEAIGKFGAARPLREWALAFNRTIAGPEFESSALNNLAGNLIYLGDYDGAYPLALAAYKLLQEFSINVVEVAHTVSWASFFQGEYTRALDYANRALGLEEGASVQPFGLIARGDALGGLGRWDEAWRSCAELLELGRAAAFPQLIGVALGGLIRVALARGETHLARDLAGEALELLAAGQHASVFEPLRTYEACYRALAACGDERAPAVLYTAYSMVMQQATWIDEPAWRSSFLQNVAVNRAICAEAARLGLAALATVAQP